MQEITAFPGVVGQPGNPECAISVDNSIEIFKEWYDNQDDELQYVVRTSNDGSFVCYGRRIDDGTSKIRALRFFMRKIIVSIMFGVRHLKPLTEKSFRFSESLEYGDASIPDEIWNYYFPMLTEAILCIERNELECRGGNLPDDWKIIVQIIDSDTESIVAQRVWTES